MVRQPRFVMIPKKIRRMMIHLKGPHWGLMIGLLRAAGAGASC
jgi:hypothetical protein